MGFSEWERNGLEARKRRVRLKFRPRDYPMVSTFLRRRCVQYDCFSSGVRFSEIIGLGDRWQRRVATRIGLAQGDGQFRRRRGEWQLAAALFRTMAFSCTWFLIHGGCIQLLPAVRYKALRKVRCYLEALRMVSVEEGRSQAVPAMSGFKPECPVSASSSRCVSLSTYWRRFKPERPAVNCTGYDLQSEFA